MTLHVCVLVYRSGKTMTLHVCLCIEVYRRWRYMCVCVLVYRRWRYMCVCIEVYRRWRYMCVCVCIEVYRRWRYMCVCVLGGSRGSGPSGLGHAVPSGGGSQRLRQAATLLPGTAGQWRWSHTVPFRHATCVASHSCQPSRIFRHY